MEKEGVRMDEDVYVGDGVDDGDVVGVDDDDVEGVDVDGVVLWIRI